MSEKFDPMAEIRKILLEWMRRQASQVILLCVGIYVMWTVGTEQLNKQELKILAQEARIETLTNEVRKCDMERAALHVEVTSLRFQLQVAFPKLQLGKTN